MLGPVFWMELHTRSRRRRLFAARTLGTAGLALVLLLVYLNFAWDTTPRHALRRVRNSSGQLVYVQIPRDPVGPGNVHSIRQLAELGREMFQSYAVGQFIMLLAIAPVYCAGCIAGDRERRVLELVFLTRLSNVELVAGKFLVRMLELCMLGVTGLPALFLCLLLGGVSWQGLLVVGALTVVIISFVASVALVVSIFASRVLTAVVLSYMALALVWAGIPIVMIMRYAGTVGPTSGPTYWTIMFNPAMGLTTALSPNIGGPAGPANPWADAYWYCLIAYSIGTILLLLAAVAMVRGVGLWASRERVPRAKRRERSTRTRRVWDNPVAWREVKTIAVHRRMRWARIMALLLLVLVSTPVWVPYMADMIDGQRAMQNDIYSFNGVIAMGAVVTWLLMTLQGSTSFAFERDRSTLDALLTTPLAGRQIVLGKLAGILRSSAFALGCPLLFIALAVMHQVMSWRAAILGAAILVVTSVLAAAWGLFCSISTSTSVKAATYAFLVALVMLIGFPFVFSSGAILGLDLRHESLRITMVSPTVNLDYATFENADRTPPDRRRAASASNLPYYLWEDRLAPSLFHVSVYAGMCVGLVLLSIQRVDRWHRVAPRRVPLLPAAMTLGRARHQVEHS